MEEVTLTPEEVKMLDELIKRMPGEFAIPVFHILNTAALRGQQNQPTDDKVQHNNTNIQQGGGDSQTLPK